MEKTYNTQIHLKKSDNSIEKLENPIYSKSTFFDEIKSNFELFVGKIQKKLQKEKSFKEILIITKNDIPKDFISHLCRQYPDKNVKVLIPAFDISELEKTDICFDFFVQNKNFEAKLYKYKQNFDNIEIFALFIPRLGEINFSKFESFAPYIKALRICAKKLSPQIIQCEEIPFFLGAEFESQWNSSIKVIQIIRDFSEIESTKLEPFWAAINLASKVQMKKICNDKIIKNYIAQLFNIHNKKRFYQIQECIDFIYQNYPKFRKYIDKCDDIEENIIFNKMNFRILKLFPKITFEGENFYNPMFYTLKKADYWSVISKTYYEEIFKRPEICGKLSKQIEKLKNKSTYFSYGNSSKKTKIYQNFNSENFRELRNKNKSYLIKEFSYNRIKTNFIDQNLFKSNEYEIHGYLDSFYEAPLIFIKLTNNIFPDGIDISLNTVLKLFELNKNVQIIINLNELTPHNYIKSWLNFIEQHSEFSGRWLFIYGEINLGQFLAAADIIFLPNRYNTKSSIHFLSMNNGCIPIASRCGIFNDTISDIFDDIAYGNGFKTKHSLLANENVYDTYFNLVIKALNLYTNNPASWNLITKNAINYNSDWTFEIIEKYNQIYNKLLA